MATEAVVPSSPWLTVDEAAARARVGRKTIYRLITEGKMRAAVVGGRRAYRLTAEWVDAALIAHAAPVEIGRRQ